MMEPKECPKCKALFMMGIAVPVEGGFVFYCSHDCVLDEMIGFYPEMKHFYEHIRSLNDE